MKKVLLILLVVMLLLGTVACVKNEEEVVATEEAAATEEATEEDAEATEEAAEEDIESGEAVSSFDYSDVKIGILGFMDSGETLDALTAYMDAVSAEIGFTYEYVAGSSYDEQTNITVAQNLISSGVDGLIMTMDSGTEAIMQECESAGVFLAGYLVEMERSLSTIQENAYYLGNVCDGFYDNSRIGEKAAELVIADGKKKVGIVTFPLIYYPGKATAIEVFTNKIEENNASADEPIEIYETQELSFTQLEETYFATYPEADAIFGLASGFIYPTVVSAGKSGEVSTYYTGCKKDDLDAFRSGDIRMLTCSNIEAVAFPIAMILNEVADMPYADKPETAERVDSSVVFITSNEELDAFEEKCLYYTYNAEDAFVTPEQLKQYLTSYNPDATYVELKEVLINMSIDDIVSK